MWFHPEQVVRVGGTFLDMKHANHNSQVSASPVGFIEIDE